MEVFRINKRNKFALFLACLLFSSFLLCTKARVEPAAGDAKKVVGAGEPEAEPAKEADGPGAGEPKNEASSPEEDEERVEEEEKQKEKELKEGKPNETEAQEVDQANGEGIAKPEAAEDGEAAQGPDNGEPEQGGEGKKDADGGGGGDEDGEGEGEVEVGGGFNQRKVDEKINGLCKPAKDANLCFNSIVAYVGNKKFAEEEINPEWILKMQVNATINQLLTIQTFIRDMLKQRPQDQVLIKCKDAYFNFATELGKASAGGDKVALKMLATDGPDKLNKECTALAGAQPGATTPEIAGTLKEVPNKNEPYLANIAQLADPPKQRKLKKMKK